MGIGGFMKSEEQLTYKEWRELTHQKVEECMAYYLLKKYKDDSNKLYWATYVFKKRDTFRNGCAVLILKDNSEILIHEKPPYEIYGVFKGKKIEIK